MSRRRSFGSVRRLPSGRWQARYDDRGPHIPLEGTFESEKEAGRALARSRQTSTGALTSARSMPRLAGRVLVDLLD
jgi:hypothetical protein